MKGTQIQYYYNRDRFQSVSSIDLNVIYDPDEIGKIIPVISSAWGIESVGTLVKDIVSAMRYHGGVVIGAYDGPKMVGMHFSFPGYRKGKVYLYSHMTGVASGLKYSGIGYMLKMKQKEWALDNGYDLIAWTFDPIMSLNASFNLRKLGTIARSYIDNFYGTMDDSINFGIPTDRVVSEWWIRKEKEVSPHEYQPINRFESEYDFDFSYSAQNLPDKAGIKIPSDFVGMKKRDKEKAIKWRMFLRDALKDMFSRGYTAVGFDPESNSYLMEKGSQFPGKENPSVFE